MTTWIVTTGSSDVQLKTNEHWIDLQENILEKLYDNIFDPSKVEGENRWKVPARVLGWVYENQLDDYFDDLQFPLIDIFSDRLKKDSIIPNMIILLLSDQSNLFDLSNRRRIKCPYWQDTCTLQTIFTKYFTKTFSNAKLQFLVLEPSTTDKGLDHWDSTLNLVQLKLAELFLEREKIIYVSHQAGTPAMSSAIQFGSLAKFGSKVKFLASNEYHPDSSEIIDSSRYLRGLRIEQAKGLIESSPGAAQKLLTNVSDIKQDTLNRLTYLVDFFNLNRSESDNEDEFSIESATRRIVDALDLIAIFLSQENYLQAITLLAAAQETFMKVAILAKISEITVIEQNLSRKGSDVLKWNEEGLYLSRQIQQKTIHEQESILNQLKFPIEIYLIEVERKFDKTNKNWAMLDWLKKLEPQFQEWALLKWSCERYRNQDNDLRNQLMHNLRGVEKQEIFKYILGSKNNYIVDVMQAYNDNVKQPFFEAIQLFKLPTNRAKLKKEMQSIKDSLY